MSWTCCVKNWTQPKVRKVTNCTLTSVNVISSSVPDDFYIKATTPPSVGFWGLYFTKPASDNATLYVPKGCKDTYAQDMEWDYFNIVEE